MKLRSHALLVLLGLTAPALNLRAQDAPPPAAQAPAIAAPVTPPASEAKPREALPLAATSALPKPERHQGPDRNSGKRGPLHEFHRGPENHGQREGFRGDGPREQGRFERRGGDGESRGHGGFRHHRSVQGHGHPRHFRGPGRDSTLGNCNEGRFDGPGPRSDRFNGGGDHEDDGRRMNNERGRERRDFDPRFNRDDTRGRDGFVMNNRRRAHALGGFHRHQDFDGPRPQNRNDSPNQDNNNRRDNQVPDNRRADSPHQRNLEGFNSFNGA